jgi:uncharacterized RDD family membrane protein YckC
MFQEYQVTYAGFWWRFLAYVIDSIIVSLVFVPLGVIFGVGIAATGADQDSPLLPAVNLGLNGIQILVMWLYHAFMESSEWQGTIGKKVLGLRVTDMNGDRVSFGKATGRYFGKILSGMICGIGYFMVAFTEKKQGLHDMMANTLVLKGPAVPDYVAPPPPPDFSYRGGGPSGF